MVEDNNNNKVMQESRKSLSSVTNSVVSCIIKQVSGKKIQISLCQLLKLVKPEIHESIINAVASLMIPHPSSESSSDL